MNYSQTINIDCNSDNATISYSECHKHFYFEKNIMPPKNHHLILALSNFIMPYSFYQLREGVNNSFEITIDNITTTITIEEGHYNVKTFTYYLNTLLLIASDILGVLLVSYFNSGNNKLYFTSDKIDATITFTFSNMLYQVMGFNEGINIFNNVSTFIAPITYNFSGTTALYIRLYNMGIQNLNSNNLCDIISCINVDVMPSNIIYYNPNQIEYIKIHRDSLNDIEIEILDDNYLPITKLNTRFRFTLSVHFEKNNNFDEKKIYNDISYNINDEETNKNI